MVLTKATRAKIALTIDFMMMLGCVIMVTGLTISGGSWLTITLFAVAALLFLRGVYQRGKLLNVALDEEENR